MRKEPTGSQIISIHASPGAAKNEIIGWISDANGQPVLKVRIAAPPEDGKANKALLKFLSAAWGIPASALELTRGEGSRHKRLKIHDDAVYTRLLAQRTVTKA